MNNIKITSVAIYMSGSWSGFAQDNAELCIKLFTGLGVIIYLSEIDIAHRVPQRVTSTANGNRRRPNPIICKVLASRGNVSRLTTEDLDLSASAEINRTAIYSHLHRDYKSCCIQRGRTKTHTTTSGAGRKAQQSSYAKRILLWRFAWGRLTT